MEYFKHAGIFAGIFWIAILTIDILTILPKTRNLLIAILTKLSVITIAFICVYLASHETLQYIGVAYIAITVIVFILMMTKPADEHVGKMFGVFIVCFFFTIPRFSIGLFMDHCKEKRNKNRQKRVIYTTKKKR